MHTIKMANRPRARRPSLATFLGDERGVAAIYMAATLPIMVGFTALAVQGSYTIYQHNVLQVAAEYAALEAASQYWQNNSVDLASGHTIRATLATTAGSDKILANADVVAGIWGQPPCVAGQYCFVASNDPSKINAVQVTTRYAKANNNQLSLFFAPGLKAFDISATAIATTAAAIGSKPLNVIIVEDITQSFSQQLTNARAADQALLDCMAANAPTGSQLGITLFTGVQLTQPYQKPLPVGDTADYNTLKKQIASINACDSRGMPACSGSNIAIGENSAISQFCSKTPCSSAANQAMVIVTDGIPNCGSAKGCTSDAKIQTDAQNASQTAQADGMEVYTIYYGNSSSDAKWLAGLASPNKNPHPYAHAFTTPKANNLASLMKNGICAPYSSLRLVW